MQPKKVFITGEDGMLAREAERYLLASSRYQILNSSSIHPYGATFKTSLNWEPEFDILSANAFDALTYADVIVHTAAYVNTDKCAAEADKAFDSNVLGTMRVIRSCLASGAKLVYFSTTAIYDVGKTSSLGIAIREDSPQKPGTYYGATKQAGESIARALLPPEQLLIVRPCFVYGSPRDTSSNIAKMIHAAIDGREVELTIDPIYSKDYLFIEDFGAAFKMLMDADAVSDVNISAGRPEIYSYIVRLLADLLGKDLKVHYRPADDYLQSHIVDNSKMRSYGWNPYVSLREGMRRQIDSIYQSRSL